MNPKVSTPAKRFVPFRDVFSRTLHIEVCIQISTFLNEEGFWCSFKVCIGFFSSYAIKNCHENDTHHLETKMKTRQKPLRSSGKKHEKSFAAVEQYMNKISSCFQICTILNLLCTECTLNLYLNCKYFWFDGSRSSN